MRIAAEVEVVAELLFKLFGGVFLRLVKPCVYEWCEKNEKNLRKIKKTLDKYPCI